jgi:DNA-binding transcriptional ArsR family regulator
VDLVFRALGDPHRRSLLDALFAQDGQTLSRLCAVLPELTRFGVMKHLGVLEAAHLVTTRKVGREKQHFLNPVPIQEIHDRWIAKFAAPWVSAMVDLKRSLEDTEPCPSPDTSSRPTSAPRPSRSGPR